MREPVLIAKIPSIEHSDDSAAPSGPPVAVRVDDSTECLDPNPNIVESAPTAKPMPPDTSEERIDLGPESSAILVETRLPKDVTSTPSPTLQNTTDIASNDSDSEQDAQPPDATAWPLPESLMRQVSELEQSLGIRTWQPELKQLLVELPTVPEFDDPKIEIILAKLATLADQLWDESRSIAANATIDDQRKSAASLSRTSYDLHRQVSLWQQVYRVAATDSPLANPKATSAQQVSFSRWNFDQVDPLWREYLGLEMLEHSGPNVRQAARTVLGRRHSVGLDAAQRALILQIVTPALENDLRLAAASPLDLSQLLVDVEAFHRQPNGYTDSRINDHFLNCIWNGRPDDLAIAQLLDDHYRNANIRVAISESFMNRMLARPRSTDEPVRDQILGAHVSGRSHITNHLGIQLVPDNRQWSLVLTTKSNVLSRTQADRDGFIIHSIGSADVFGSKRMSVSFDGVQSESPQVEAVTDNQVIGLDSPFDDVPVLGWTARRIAQRKQQAAAPVADQIIRSRIRSRVQERMEQSVTAALQKVKAELDRLIVSRFVEWSLEPQPVEMRTTENEIILRYRLAGFDQMGANTPRPAIDDQMAVSLQLHESAVNNGLARLDLAGESFTLATLTDQLETKLNMKFEPAGEDLHQVEIGFAPFDPIRVDFADGCVALTMNLKRLQINRGKNWRNVTVQTRYAVQFDGFYLTLQQVGGVRASGSRVRVRDEIAIGAIFDQLLNNEYRFSLLPQTYEADFTQAGIRLAHIGLADGWLSVAYREAPTLPSVTPQAIRLLPRMR